MLSNREILLGILLPLLVSLAIGALAAWKRQAWLLPLGAGLGFLLGYANSLGGAGAGAGGFGLPAFPPSDGTDWFFWTMLPAIVLATLAGRSNRAWPTILGVWAGVIVWVILRPLVPATLSSAATLSFAMVAAIAAPIEIGALRWTAQRTNHAWMAAAISIVVGGASIVVLSSNLRTGGVYGLGGAAALAGTIPFAGRLKAIQPIAIFALCLLCGVLACGLFYPDPGVKPAFASILAGAPLLVLLGPAVPTKKPWVRGAVAVFAVAIVVGAVALPAALAAKHAAEDYPTTSGY
jgi:hypothetical protein